MGLKESEEIAKAKLDAKVDKIINPIYNQIYLTFKEFSCSGISIEKLDETVKDLIGVALFEGANLNEQISNGIESKVIQTMRQVQENNVASTLLAPDNRAKDASIALNMRDKSGKFNRFTTPEDYKEK